MAGPLTVEEMNTIMNELLLGKEPTLTGGRYDIAREAIKKDIEKAEKEGMVLTPVRE